MLSMATSVSTQTRQKPSSKHFRCIWGYDTEQKMLLINWYYYFHFLEEDTIVKICNLPRILGPRSPKSRREIYMIQISSTIIINFCFVIGGKETTIPAFLGFRIHLSYLSFGIHVYPNVQAWVFHIRWSLFVFFSRLSTYYKLSASKLGIKEDANAIDLHITIR